MLHENLVRTNEIAGPSNRRFGLTIGAACWIIGGIRALTGHSHLEWWLAAGLVIAVLAVAWPDALAPLNRGWLKLGFALQKVVNPIVMAVLFASTIVPIGLLLRLSGKDPLRLRRNPNAATYWIARQPSAPATEAMKKQF
jgi:Saxitoxin biosynthesis operon protein SxtJ